MNEIIINNSCKTKVFIGNNVNLSDFIFGYNRILILSDTNVSNLYGNSVLKQLKKNNNIVLSFSINPGEKNKNIQTIVKITDFISENNFSRNDLIVTLGGGIVSDVGGFVASIYKRGIKLCHIPTTILGAVDASIGGKTGINTAFGKNILGSFYNPLKVIIDVDFFSSLPYKEINCGKAEILKYAFIDRTNILDLLSSKNVEKTIQECVETKKKFVEQDEFDYGARMMLNFGHTVGHAIEKYSNYEVSHGEAVSIGMATMSRFFGVKDIEKILVENNLPITYDVNENDLMNIVKIDKKTENEIYKLIVPVRLGTCEIRSFNERQVVEILKRVKS